MQPKHKLSIAIAGCGVLLVGMWMAIQVMHHISPSSSPYQATPIVTPVNAYRAGGHHTTQPASYVRDELALEAVKGEKEMWNAQQSAKRPQNTQPSTSYIGKTSSQAPISLPKREKGVRSVGGGAGMNTTGSMVSSSPSPSENLIAQVHYTLPAMRSRQTEVGPRVSAPFSERMAHEDLQLRARPGSGSGTGTVVPTGECPWVLFLIFPIIIYLRRRRGV